MANNDIYDLQPGKNVFLSNINMQRSSSGWIVCFDAPNFISPMLISSIPTYAIYNLVKCFPYHFGQVFVWLFECNDCLVDRF